MNPEEAMNELLEAHARKQKAMKNSWRA